MGMISRSSFQASLAVFALLLAAQPVWAKTDYHSGIWNLLRATHFDFAANGDSHASRAGSLRAGGKWYDIWSFAWEETPKHMTGSTPHGHYNLLIFEKAKNGLSFVGDYDFEGDSFRIQGKTLKFS